MNDAKSKEVFQVYKYTKFRNVEKLSFISHNDEIKFISKKKMQCLDRSDFFTFIRKRSEKTFERSSVSKTFIRRDKQF